jgi:hypothetical protein
MLDALTMQAGQDMRLGLRVAIIVIVGLAAGAVLWLKPRGPAAPSAQTAARRPAQTTVLLFADPSEANSSCGCGEIIRMVRSLKRSRGDIAVREYQPAQDTAIAQKHAVRVSPTVIISSRGGRAPLRFEGESTEVIVALRAALKNTDRAHARPSTGER